MTTDWRALCAELTHEVEQYADDRGDLMPECADRARAALAAEPVAEGPTDTQLIEEAIAVGLAFQPQDEVSEVFLPFDAEEPLDELLVNFARAVLARFGNHSPDARKMVGPAEGDVAELVVWLRGANWDSKRQTLATRAADLLEQFSSGWVVPTVEQFAPVPVAERLPDASDPRECRMPDGSCWWFDPHEDGAWYFDAYQSNYTHWLPAHALPLPYGEVE